MIHEESIYQAELLETQLGERACLTTPTDSPLRELAEASYPIELNLRGATRTLGVETSLIGEASRNKNQEGVVMHDVVTGEMVNAAANAVTASLRLARTVVKPVIISAVETSKIEMDRIQKTKAQPLAVLADHFDDTWNNPILASLVEPYEEMAMEAVSSVRGMPKLTAVQIREYCKTGIERFDEDLMKLVNATSDADIEKIFHAGFVEAASMQNRPYSINELMPLKDLLSKPERNRDEVLMIHFMAKQLMVNVPDEARGDLNLYKETVAKTIAQTGRGIGRVIARRELLIKRKELIISYPPRVSTVAEYYGSDYVIMVNGDVYNRWLKEGGAPEALFGAASTTQAKGYNELLENVEDYKQRWAREQRIIGSRLRNEKFNNVVESLTRAVAAEIVKFDDEALPAPREAMQAQLKLVAAKLTAEDIENVYRAARTVVCRSMFPHTDAERILTAIDVAAANNPGVSPREAATIATIDVVADWISEWINVERY